MVNENYPILVSVLCVGSFDNVNLFQIVSCAGDGSAIVTDINRAEATEKQVLRCHVSTTYEVKKTAGTLLIASRVFHEFSFLGRYFTSRSL